MSTKKASSQQATQVLTAQNPITHKAIKIGDRDYVLREMLFENTLLFGDVLMDEADALDQAGLLDADTWKDFKPSDVKRILDTLRKVWQRVPHFMGRVLALALNATEPDDPEYILANISNLQFSEVVLAFMQNNAVGDLFVNFFRIRRETLRIADEIRAALAEEENTTS